MTAPTLTRESTLTAARVLVADGNEVVLRPSGGDPLPDTVRLHPVRPGRPVSWHRARQHGAGITDAVYVVADESVAADLADAGAVLVVGI